MCGIAAAFGENWSREDLGRMVDVQTHRGPDCDGMLVEKASGAGLGHNRLSIIDLTDAGRQPMVNASGRLAIIFNGEIYNFLELKRELEAEFEFRTQTDTEVLLAAYEKWGEEAFDRLIGMFAFVIWDKAKRRAVAVRDRFGVKPLYYHIKDDGTLLIASEIKALHAAGVPREGDERTWATYLVHGLYNHSDSTFWKGIKALPAGCRMTWQNGRTDIACWYDLVESVGDEIDRRPVAEVEEEYFQLMKESVKLRFRSDVPVGINLSGGLDSSTLLGLVHAVQGPESDAKAFTFITGDPSYDELPWVGQMLADTNHSLVVSKLSASEVPDLAADVQYFQDEPFGGIPTLAYAQLFRKARANGVIVLLDGNGMDEQWAGYDYYGQEPDPGRPVFVQGVKERPVRPDCLTPEFRALADEPEFTAPFGERVADLQFRDICYTKIPRAMRFNDRVSMRSSTELREPFLDHRLFELALRQPVERKISDGVSKRFLRNVSKRVVPAGLARSPKRALQTPQREWLRTDLSEWAGAAIGSAVSGSSAGWFERNSVEDEWRDYQSGISDNSFYIWQWVSLSLMAGAANSRSRVKGLG